MAPGWGHFQTSSCSAHAQTCRNSDTHTSHLSGAFWFTKALSMLLPNLSLATIPRQAFYPHFTARKPKRVVAGGRGAHILAPSSELFPWDPRGHPWEKPRTTAFLDGPPPDVSKGTGVSQTPRDASQENLG